MPPEVAAQHISEAMAECISSCAACHDSCLEALGHCLERGGGHAAAARIRALSDCTQLCEVTRDALLRGSSLHGELRELCAVACARCADSCEELAREDPMMERCVDDCRRCVDSCR